MDVFYNIYDIFAYNILEGLTKEQAFKSIVKEYRKQHGEDPQPFIDWYRRRELDLKGWDNLAKIMKDIKP